jgi:hypothetical protein
VVALVRRLLRLPFTQGLVGLRHLREAAEDEAELDRHGVSHQSVPSLSKTATRS